MTLRAFGITCYKVHQLDFVDTVSVPASIPLVFVELSPRLVAILPPEWHVLEFSRHDFTVNTVLSRYEWYIQKLVRHEFYEAAQVASEMLKTAKGQLKS